MPMILRETTSAAESFNEKSTMIAVNVQGEFDANHRSRMHVFPFIFSSHLRVRWVLRRCSNIDQSRCSMFFFRLLFSHCAFF